MASSYNELLTTSTQYTSLQDACSTFELVCGHINDLNNAMAESSGTDIEYARDTFNGFSIDKFGPYKQKVEGIMKQLKSNADKMDVVLNNWKAKEGTEMEGQSCYYSADGLSPSPASGTDSDEFNSANALSYLAPGTPYSFYAKKSSTYIESVCIGSSFYIDVHVKIVVSTYVYSPIAVTLNKDGTKSVISSPSYSTICESGSKTEDSTTYEVWTYNFDGARIG